MEESMTQASVAPSFIKRIVVLAGLSDADLLAAAHAVRESTAFPSLKTCEVMPLWDPILVPPPTALNLGIADHVDRFSRLARRLWAAAPSEAELRALAVLAINESIRTVEHGARHLRCTANVLVFPHWSEPVLPSSEEERLVCLRKTARSFIGGSPSVLVQFTADRSREGDHLRFLDLSDRPEVYARLTHGRFTRAYFMAQAAEIAFSQVPGL